jgi:HPt (histidine-containing phosphotransfer) domain-containing protein
MPEVCNFKRLKDISMGDDAFAEELVRVFLEDAASQLERLRAAVERSDCRETAETAHRMRGAGGNVGAEVLAQVCNELESAARNSVTDDLAGAFANVDRELERARTAFESELGVR